MDSLVTVGRETMLLRLFGNGERALGASASSAGTGFREGAQEDG